jgi:hypothetical protein
MGRIKAKQTFMMRNGEIRIPWKTTADVPDEDIIAFITSDAVYSKNKKWRTVFEILSFDDKALEEKHHEAIYDSPMAISNVEIDLSEKADNGRIDARSIDYAGRKNRIVNEFAILNDKERNDALFFLKENNDIDALGEIRTLLKSRGENRRWVSEVESILNIIEIKKSNEAATSAVDEINSYQE